MESDNNEDLGLYNKRPKTCTGNWNDYDFSNWSLISKGFFGEVFKILRVRDRKEYAAKVFKQLCRDMCSE